MKLFFDHNLSPQLVQHLADLYPNASHVALVGLERASDSAVWNYAQANIYIIVTKDSDFNDMSILRGFPPKVIWLQLGNCTTGELETALRQHHTAIQDFANDPAAGVLVIV